MDEETSRQKGLQCKGPGTKNELNILGNGKKALEAGMEHVGAEEQEMRLQRTSEGKRAMVRLEWANE